MSETPEQEPERKVPDQLAEAMEALGRAVQTHVDAPRRLAGEIGARMTAARSLEISRPYSPAEDIAQLQEDVDGLREEVAAMHDALQEALRLLRQRGEGTD